VVRRVAPQRPDHQLEAPDLAPLLDRREAAGNRAVACASERGQRQGAPTTTPIWSGLDRTTY
jgi:hypothetical protein